MYRVSLDGWCSDMKVGPPHRRDGGTGPGNAIDCAEQLAAPAPTPSHKQDDRR